MNNPLGNFMVIAGVIVLMLIPSAFVLNFFIEPDSLVAIPVAKSNADIFSESELNSASEPVDASEPVQEPEPAPVVDEPEQEPESQTFVSSTSSSSSSGGGSRHLGGGTSRSKKTPELNSKLENDGEARVIVSFSQPSEKDGVLEILEGNGIDAHSEWSDGVAFTADKGTIDEVEQQPGVSLIEEDIPLQTMTYEGFDLIDLDEVLVDGRLTLNTTWPTLSSKMLQGKGIYNLTGNAQTVCMIDSGIANGHPEFSGKVIAQWDFFEGDAFAQDTWNHGTRMAGVIAAKGANMSGIAYKSNIVMLRITDATGGSWSSLLNSALDWCTNNASQFNITSVYIGVGLGTYTGTEGPCTGGTAGKINTLVSNNITVVAPAGVGANSTAIAFPACAANAISVGAVPDGGSNPADTWNLTGGGVQSNRRPGLLDLLAPGGDGTTTTTNASNYIGSTRVGTSISAAYVTGAVMIFKEFWDARAWNVRPGGLINGNQPNTIEYIFNRTGKLVYDPQSNFSYPRLDIFKAINYEENPPVASLETANNTAVGPGSIQLDYNVTDQHEIDNCSLYINGSLNQTDSTITKATTQSFNVNLGLGSYSWRVDCADNATFSNTGSSAANAINVQDMTPPGTVTSLSSPSQGTTWIYWTWTNPVDADFDQAIVFIGLTNVVNTTNNFYNATGLSPNTSYTIKVHTKDTTGNVNNTDVVDTNSTLPSPDVTPPAAITSLSSPSKGTDWIYWTWTNPADGDFSQNIVFINGSNVVNTSNNFYNATGLSPNVSYQIKVHTKDTTGNVNNTDVIDIVTTNALPDLTPPATVTGLSSPSQGTTWVYWTWTNPADGDFSQNIVYINGSNAANTSNNFYNATGLSPNTSYQIKIHTKDTTGNVNNTDVIDLTSTLPTLDITPPAAITGLSSPSQGTTWIYWTWTNPVDADFDQAIVFINGSNVVNTTNNFYNATGLPSNTSYQIKVHTKDTNGNVNNTDVIDLNATLPALDITPPATITGLSSPSKSTDWIYWTWTNPADGDFSQNIVFIGAVNVVNTSNNFYNATGLSSNTSYTINVHTKDTTGNVNNTDVTGTVSTDAIPLLPELWIKNSSVYTSTPTLGSWTTFKIIIENIGDVMATGIYWIFDTNYTTPTNLSFGPFNLSVNESVAVYPSVKYNASGTYNTNFTVDANNVITEYNETNNQVIIPVTIP